MVHYVGLQSGLIWKWILVLKAFKVGTNRIQ